jgi:hypothetical protein
MSMGFKKTIRNLDFADLTMATCLEQYRSIKLMEQPRNIINWSRVESILLSHFTVGTSEEDARAYPPLMLFNGTPLKFSRDLESDWVIKGDGIMRKNSTTAKLIELEIQRNKAIS